MSAIHIGISGWRYTPWRGGFYPKGLGHGRQPSDPQLIAPRHLDKNLATTPGEPDAKGVLS
ncbi:hypothetical protein D3C84_390990 [compost metagenome]